MFPFGVFFAPHAHIICKPTIGGWNTISGSPKSIKYTWTWLKILKNCWILLKMKNENPAKVSLNLVSF